MEGEMTAENIFRFALIAVLGWIAMELTILAEGKEHALHVMMALTFAAEGALIYRVVKDKIERAREAEGTSP